MGCTGSKHHALRQDHAVGSSAPPQSHRAPEYDTLFRVAQLPAQCRTATCHHVYDGDTLTLSNQQRVRLLGVDTPELKQREPFAQEAKDLTSRLCPPNSTLYLASGPEAEDKYGRLLAVVYVSDTTNNGYICVNISLVLSGFAGYYSVGPELAIKGQLLQAQSQARSSRRGLWSGFTDVQVCATSHGRCFHQRHCEHVAKIRHLRTLLKSAAMDEGLSSCRDCHA